MSNLNDSNIFSSKDELTQTEGVIAFARRNSFETILESISKGVTFPASKDSFVRIDNLTSLSKYVYCDEDSNIEGLQYGDVVCCILGEDQRHLLPEYELDKIEDGVTLLFNFSNEDRKEPRYLAVNNEELEGTRFLPFSFCNPKGPTNASWENNFTTTRDIYLVQIFDGVSINVYLDSYAKEGILLNIAYDNGSLEVLARKNNKTKYQLSVPIDADELNHKITLDFLESKIPRMPSGVR